MRRDEWLLVVVVVALICCGLIAVHSVAIAQVMDQTKLHNLLAKRVAFAVIAILALLLASKIDYHILYNKVVLFTLLGSSAALLLACKFSPLGYVQNGAARWLGRPPFAFQPSEIAKLVTILFMAWAIAKYRRSLLRFETVFCLSLLPLAFSALILIEPDFGTAALIPAIAILLIFMAGADLFQIFAYTHLLAVAGAAFVVSSPYRLARITSFLDPFGAGDKGYNLVQSLTAVALGNITGVGLGNGVQEAFYLPCANSDFILAIVAEETGMFGIVLLALLYGTFLCLGWQIAKHARDFEGKLIALGITFMIVGQALFNMGVVLRLLPTKGIPLPFISAGGTSLIVMAATVGVLLNVARQRESMEMRPRTVPLAQAPTTAEAA